MLVGVHSNIQNRIANNPINNSKPFYRSNTKSITDSFQKQNVSFKGKKLSSGEYTDEEIKLMKSTLKSSDETWKDDLYKKQYNHLLANRGKWENVGRYGRGTFDPNSPFERVVCGIFTFGATELGVQIENIGLRKDAKNYVNQMDILRADLQNMKLKEDVAETHKAEKSAEHKVEYLKGLQDVKENQLQPKFLDLVQNEKEGHPVDMPNCIMLSNKNDEINNQLINWTGENINGKFISIKNGDDILAHLEQAEDDYQNTGDWNLIAVKGMDKLIDHNQVKDRTIESMKDIMTAAAEDYHSTLIFSSTHPETLDSIALQPHRVKKIKTADIKTPKDMDIEDAKVRLMDSQNAKNTPISTINDLLLVAKADDSLKLSWEHTPEQLEKAENVITNTFNKNEDKHYLKMYNIAKDNLV